MFDIILPVSHLFKTEENVEIIKDLCDGFETRHDSFNCVLDNQLFFHADKIQPIHNMSDSEFYLIEKIKSQKKDLKYISFHCASNCKNPEVGNNMFQAGKDSTLLTRDEMFLNAEKNIEIIKKIVGDEVSILIENNNFYPTKAYDDVCDPDFISDIVNDNKIYFLFDNAHAAVSAHNMKTDYKEYIKKLPMEKTKQIQFCKPFIPKKSDEIARDVHELPDQKIIEEILEIAKTNNVKYITPEYYFNIKKLRDLLLMLNNIRKR